MLVVIGIGGSYLGARAAIEMLTSSFRNNTEYPEIVLLEIIYHPHTLKNYSII